MGITKKDIQKLREITQDIEVRKTVLRIDEPLIRRVEACKHRLGSDTISNNSFICLAVELLVDKLEQN